MRLRLALAVGTLLMAAAAPAATAAHAGIGDKLSVDSYGTVAEDGTVTVSGTYRCMDDSAGPVFVSSTLVQQENSAGIGGTRAVCDSRERTWTNSGVVKEPGYRAGAARVKATLMQLTTTHPTGLPLPAFLVAEEADVTLR